MTPSTYVVPDLSVPAELSTRVSTLTNCISSTNAPASACAVDATGKPAASRPSHIPWRNNCPNRVEKLKQVFMEIDFGNY